MQGITQAALIGTLPRAGTFRKHGDTEVFEGVLAMESLVGDRVSRNYVPFVVIGSAALALFNRTGQGSVLSIQGTPRQEKWESEGEKRSRVRIHAQRTEVIAPGPTVTDRGGAPRLVGGVNTVTLGGNLVATPHLRKTRSGETVTDFTLAINEKVRTRGGQLKERTSFVTVVAWKAVAEQVATLHKGAALTLTGAAVSESWTDRTGQKRSTLKFEAVQVFQVQPQ